MITAVRQRIPFRFSEDDEQDEHVLDEQEQEQVIDRLRQESASSNEMYSLGLQAVIGLSLLLHVLYMLRSSGESPLAVLFQNASLRSPMPLASVFTLLQILIHCNLGLNTLPLHNRLRRAVQRYPSPTQLPVPISHPLSVFAPALAPLYAFLMGQDWVDVLWWSTAGCLTFLVAAVLKWMREEEQEIAELEKLRYDARGA
ncbi:hypothetical protein PYCCODRAFT_1381746 [Trametes coccinea BRFM310]|uniref:Uncharacterized protein n=1 Tax=Trametes coccinea (strain BRFM310) TaxID=1353009 RepID=A0A1Y2J2S4_TRAC3|nr:hypothetical protein PYCCODRAFT_1381746 [Trametes coccinea BRFM310]